MLVPTAAEAIVDGLLDEIDAGDIEFDDDTDDDGLLDGNETLTDPLKADTDGDGVLDGTESGLPWPQGRDTDPAVFVADADPASLPSLCEFQRPKRTDRSPRLRRANGPNPSGNRPTPDPRPTTLTNPPAACKRLSATASSAGGDVGPPPSPVKRLSTDFFQTR